ncbi:MAG: hypothetical protein ACLR5S_06445 [Ruminococcus sp.]
MVCHRSRGLIAAFVLKLPVLTVYILINVDEIIKLPAVLRTTASTTG